MRLFAAVLLFAGATATCAFAHEPNQNNSVHALVRTECGLPDGWLQVDAHNPDFVVFGESHGTKESPAFVDNLVCALAHTGERVLLAVELSSIFNEAMQEAWSSAPEDFPKRLSRTGWVGRSDGVGSEAMFDLLVNAHRLKAAGGAIAIVAFNGTKDDAQRERFADLPGQGPHEAAQAENIALAKEAGKFDHVIILVGNLHAEKEAITMRDITFDPMAVRLSEYGTVMSFDMRDAGGSAWNCQLRKDYINVPGKPIPDDAIECGEHPSGTYGELKKEPFIGMGAFPGQNPRPSFDGYFWLGKISASPPAFAKR